MSYVLQGGPTNVGGYGFSQQSCLTSNQRLTIGSVSIAASETVLIMLSAESITSNGYSGTLGHSGYMLQLSPSAAPSLVEYVNGNPVGAPSGTSSSPSAPTLGATPTVTSIIAQHDGAGAISITYTYSGTTYTITATDTGVKTGLFAGVKVGGINSSATAVRWYTFDSGVAPLAVTDLAFSGVTKESITVTLQPNTGGDAATDFKLYKRVSGGAWGGPVSQASPIFICAGLAANTVYEFKAAAHNLAGDSPESAVESQGTLNPATGGGGDLSIVGGPTLDGVTVSPAIVERAMSGAQIQYTAKGYVGGVLNDPLAVTWSVMEGDAAISSGGLLTVGLTGGQITIKAIGSYDPTKSSTAIIREVTKDMDDVSIQSLTYKNGIYSGEIIFNSTPGRVKVKALAGGVEYEKIFGPGLVVPIAWNLGIQSQEVRFITVGLPAS